MHAPPCPLTAPYLDACDRVVRVRLGHCVRDPLLDVKEAAVLLMVHHYHLAWVLVAGAHLSERGQLREVAAAFYDLCVRHKHALRVWQHCGTVANTVRISLGLLEHAPTGLPWLSTQTCTPALRHRPPPLTRSSPAVPTSGKSPHTS